MSGTDFYYEELVALAEKLAEIAPGDVPRRVSFGNSGAEAIEGAIKLARYATGRDKIIAFFGSFHGRTMGALSLTSRKAVQRAGFGPLIPGVVHAPYPYCYRCPYGQTARQLRGGVREAHRRHAAQDHRAGRRDRRHRGGTGAGRGRLRRAAAEILRRTGARGQAERHPAGLRRSAERHGPHRQDVGGASISAWCRTSSPWPRESPAACRWAPRWRART